MVNNKKMSAFLFSAITAVTLMGCGGGCAYAATSGGGSKFLGKWSCNSALGQLTISIRNNGGNNFIIDNYPVLGKLSVTYKNGSLVGPEGATFSIDHQSGKLIGMNICEMSRGIIHKATTNGWSIKTNVNQMTDQKTMVAFDKATAPLTGSFGSSYTPVLFMGCGGGSSQAYIAIALGASISGGNMGGNNYPVDVRFDKNKEFKTTVVLDPQQSNVYAFNNQSKILREGSKAKRMLFQFETGYAQLVKIADFDISGMSGTLHKMHCNLPLAAPSGNANSSYTSSPNRSVQVSHSAAAVAPYVKSMPSVEQVMSKVNGKNALDTAARQRGVFDQLINMLENIEGPRQFFHNKLTTEEIQLRQSYVKAENKIFNSVQHRLTVKEWTKWYNKMLSYSEDKKYVLNLFFNTKFKREYQLLSRD